MKILLLSFMTACAWGGFAPPGTKHCNSAVVTSGTTFSCTLGSAPAVGSVVIAHVFTFQGLTLSSVSDGTTTYSTPPSTSGCSATLDASAGTICIRYLIPSMTGGTTITATVSGGTCTACAIHVFEFAVSSGTATFNSGLAGSNTTQVPNLPTITVSGSGSLVWGSCADSDNCGAASAPWTGDPVGVGADGTLGEYQLSVSTNQTVAFTGSSSFNWDTYGVSFSFTPSAAVTRHRNHGVF